MEMAFPHGIRKGLAAVGISIACRIIGVGAKVNIHIVLFKKTHGKACNGT